MIRAIARDGQSAEPGCALPAAARAVIWRSARHSRNAVTGLNQTADSANVAVPIGALRVARPRRAGETALFVRREIFLVSNEISSLLPCAGREKQITARATCGSANKPLAKCDIINADGEGERLLAANAIAGSRG